MSVNTLTRKLLSRDAFLTLFVLSFGGIAGLVVGIPIIGYVLSPLIRTTPDVWSDVSVYDAASNKSKLARPDDIPIGQTVEVTYNSNAPLEWAGTTARQAAWLRRTGSDTYKAFAVYCTHLGCPVHWLQHPQIFLCPCHGSVFNADGTVAGGPAPRPLFTWDVRLHNGHIQIKTHPLPVVT